jgi:predicted dehydrogenase
MKRRSFIKYTSATGATLMLPISCISQTGNQPQGVGVALVGLGYYSTDVLSPAFAHTKHCYLAGIVTGTPSKIPIWQERHSIKDQNIYDYDNFDKLANNDEIDAVYIVLPNGLHAEYAIKAAEAGKHVWCEKPMAVDVDECQAIIDACNANKVKLTIGYRMQHEPNTQTVIQYAKNKPYGNINKITAEAAFSGFSDKSHWKVRKELSGGAMYDMGVYSINGARYAAGEEPIAVRDCRHETTRPHIFDEVDETTYFTMEFPGGAIAECRTSFGHRWNQLNVECENGWYKLAPMQAYNGVKGETSDGSLLNKTIVNQQAKQMDDDALAILNNTDVLVPGEEGLRDVRILQAVYESASKGGERILLS